MQRHQGGRRAPEGADMSTASEIVAGLGGRDNITDLEPCITRLRVEVVDQEKVDEQALRASGAFGVVRSGRVVQVVVGPTADVLASEIAALD
ncbi:PTS glucose/sucrose transporter subunit IIB [Actinomyces oricola]|uniref:PTS glucose/sucrose transporter subunit IIB n=1 Tax=Actinomyces oricola TaxID=206043 RepID=UPI00240DE1CA|nr:PTS glucose/sucrose transporter subunit IIB [Actinomyces oricola]